MVLFRLNSQSIKVNPREDASRDTWRAFRYSDSIIGPRTLSKTADTQIDFVFVKYTFSFSVPKIVVGPGPPCHPPC